MDDRYFCGSFFCEEYGDNIYSWMVGRYDSAIYCLDYERMQSTRIIELPRSGRPREFLYTYIVSMGDTLIITPQNAFNVCVYDKNEKKLNDYKLSVEYKYGGYNSIGGFSIDDVTFFFSCYGDMPPFKTNGYYVSRITLWDELTKEIGIDSGGIVASSVCRYKDGCVLGINDSGIIVYYNAIEDTHRILLEIGDIRIKYTYIYGDILYISQKGGGDIVVVDLDRCEEMKRIHIDEKYGELIDVLFDGNVLYGVLRQGHRILKITMDTNDIQEIECDCDGLVNFYPETKRYFVKGKVGRDKIFLLPYNTNGIVEIDKNTLIASFCAIETDESPNKMLYNIYHEFEVLLYEDDLSLKDYLCLVSV